MRPNKACITSLSLAVLSLGFAGCRERMPMTDDLGMDAQPLGLHVVVDRVTTMCDRVELHVDVRTDAHIGGLPESAFTYELVHQDTNRSEMRTNECFAEVGGDGGAGFYRICLTNLLPGSHLLRLGITTSQGMVRPSIFFATTCGDAGTDAARDASAPDVSDAGGPDDGGLDGGDADADGPDSEAEDAAVDVPTPEAGLDGGDGSIDAPGLDV